jgi:hypothetical protein
LTTRSKQFFVLRGVRCPLVGPRNDTLESSETSAAPNQCVGPLASGLLAFRHGSESSIVPERFQSRRWSGGHPDRGARHMIELLPAPHVAPARLPPGVAGKAADWLPINPFVSVPCLKLQQPQLPRSEPDGRPTESSHLSGAISARIRRTLRDACWRGLRRARVPAGTTNVVSAVVSGQLMLKTCINAASLMVLARSAASGSGPSSAPECSFPMPRV